METLVLVADHRDQHYNRGKSHGSARFGSSPSRGFREINCRAFECGGAVLCTPLKFSSTPLSYASLSSPKTPTPTHTPTVLCTPLKFSSTPLSYASLSSPKTPTPTPTPTHTPTACNKSGDGKPFKRRVKGSNPISISFKGGKKESPQNHHTPFSELWAGPAYSNSPPPSSLPIPKFQMKPKRTVSLELPTTTSEINLYPIAKSAPASPTRELKHSAITFLHNDDAATKTLRRMLNLDVADD